MLPFLALHNIAAPRGDGLSPEFLALLERARAQRVEAPISASSNDNVNGLAQPPISARPVTSR